MGCYIVVANELLQYDNLADARLEFDDIVGSARREAVIQGDWTEDHVVLYFCEKVVEAELFEDTFVEEDLVEAELIVTEHMVEDPNDVRRERDEARAEVERLRVEVALLRASAADREHPLHAAVRHAQQRYNAGTGSAGDCDRAVTAWHEAGCPEEREVSR